MGNEPVRIATVVAGTVVAVAGALVATSQGARWRGAAGVALAQLGLVVAAGECARARVYGPVTARELEARADELEQALMLEQGYHDA